MPLMSGRRRRQGGVLLKLLFILAGLLAAAVLAWMVLLPHVVASHLRQRTGFDVAFQALMVNPFTGELHARGMVINNPPTFARPEFLQAREITAVAEGWSWLGDKPVLKRLELDIALLALVKRADQRTNMEVFRGYLGPKAPGRASTESGSARHYLIKELRVRFDRLLVADHTKRVPVVQDHAVKLDRTFTNVGDIRELLLPEALNELFLLGGSVGSILPDEISRIFDQVLGSGQDLMKRTPRPETEALKGFSDALEESKKP
ncbi:MAG: hypothetical protein H3C27_09275 [Opitutaceae bacterium]|nr:hypothetical protein [Opitutaceae bacterium]